MSTITIPAREVKPGDVIDFGGQPFTVKRSDKHADVADVYTFWGSVHQRGIFDHSALIIHPEQLLTVTRPDPDAELIEVMAKAWWEADGSSWRNPDPTTQVRVRDYARAALAAAREAGLL